jgi:Flp pilus assembly protein TadG
MRRRKTSGSVMVEFVLCGVPMVFVWISTVQMSLGMWHYHTLQYATKAAGAYMATHGASYVAAGNTAPEIENIATVLANAAIGIPASSIQVTFTAFQGNSTATSTTHSCELDTCESDTTVWPPTGYNTVGNDFEIKTEFQWKNALAMVAPGHGTQSFGAFWLPGYTHQFILF